MEKAATDIYTFKDLREGGFTYVDKTGLLLPLVDFSIGKQFFMARPRRFWKGGLSPSGRAIPNHPMQLPAYGHFRRTAAARRQIGRRNRAIDW